MISTPGALWRYRTDLAANADPGFRGIEQKEYAMKVKRYTEVTNEDADMEDASGTTIRWLLGPADAMPNFHMRMIEVEPGGHTPRHTHHYEHEVYVLEGRGELIDPEGEPIAIGPGSVAYVAPDELHQFRNTGEATLRFLCLVPKVE